MNFAILQYPASNCDQDALHVVQILLRLQRVVDAVVSRLIKFFVAQLRIVPEMRAAGRFHRSTR